MAGTLTTMVKPWASTAPLMLPRHDGGGAEDAGPGQLRRGVPDDRLRPGVLSRAR
jgi:hypothetical protein